MLDPVNIIWNGVRYPNGGTPPYPREPKRGDTPLPPNTFKLSILDWTAMLGSIYSPLVTVIFNLFSNGNGYY